MPVNVPSLGQVGASAGKGANTVGGGGSAPPTVGQLWPRGNS